MNGGPGKIHGKKIHLIRNSLDSGAFRRRICHSPVYTFVNNFLSALRGARHDGPLKYASGWLTPEVLRGVYTKGSTHPQDCGGFDAW